MSAARACRAVVFTNIAIAALVKLAMVALVLGWSGTQLWMGVVTDVGALLLVTLNGTRLLRSRGGADGVSPAAGASGASAAVSDIEAARGEKSPLLNGAASTFRTFSK